MALTGDKNAPERDGRLASYPAAAGVVIYNGALVVLNAGNAAPGFTALNLVAVGRADQQVDNTGGIAGAKTVTVRRGVFLFNNSAGVDEIGLGDVGSDCFIVDDETVALTNGTNTRSPAGKIFDVDAQGVWVRVG
ncbi:MAG: hypothetical protein MJA83_19415 [Gammaproteobacteria bacterium]|nr:hypothetical protein [Gammaproteobacteria bacterium]